MIYIDGSHKYEDVLSDLRHSLQNLSKKGIIILDDSSLYTNYSSEKIERKYKIKSTKGHEGPSLALNEIIKNNLNLKILITVGHMNVIGFK